ncbi:MAG: DNA polymerase Y family protein [Pseudomonadota bacterium]
MKKHESPHSAKEKTGRLILALWFPSLSSDRIMRLEKGRFWRKKAMPEAPLVITTPVKNAERIIAVNESAANLGIAEGTTLADARARHPGVRAEKEDAWADMALLETIADWADRYTPLVALDRAGSTIRFDGPKPVLFRHGLFLDLTGCAHLFAKVCQDGERPCDALLADLKTRLFDHGFEVRTGLSGSPGAAWALSRFYEGPPLLTKEDEQCVLNTLPVAALRLDPDTVTMLERVGLKTLGDLFQMPRAPLAHRFGMALLERLDAVSNGAEESLSPRLPTPDLMAERHFAEPIARHEDVERTLSSLAETLSVTLAEKDEGARLLEASLFQSDGAVTRAHIAAARPLRNPSDIARLFKERLHETLARFEARMNEDAAGFDLIRLAVVEKEPLHAVQTAFAEDPAGQYAMTELDAGLAHLIDKLNARFGGQCAFRLDPGDCHQPETAEERRPPGTPRKQQATEWDEEGGTTHTLFRPIRLFERPEAIEALAGLPDGPPLRFRWRKLSYRVVKADGPERISDLWWQTPGKNGLTRDYYRVEDEDGRRFWLYRNGLYDNESDVPGWYMHGLFA